MKPLFILLALMVLLTIGASLHAQDAGMTAEETNAQLAQDVAAAIADLDNAEFEKRDAALKNLIIIGEPAVPQLRQALKAKERGPEFTTRALRVIELYELGSPENNGIVCTLEADRKKVKPGETAVLTVTLANRGKKNLLLNVGHSTGGISFENGHALRLVTMKGDGADRRLNFAMPKWQVGFCGTGAHAIYMRLPAGATKTYRCEVHFDNSYIAKESRTSVGGGEAGLSLGAERYTFLPAAMEGTVRLSVVHSIVTDIRCLSGKGYGWGARIDDQFYGEMDPKLIEGLDPFVGEVRSNDVKIAIEPAAPGK